MHAHINPLNICEECQGCILLMNYGRFPLKIILTLLEASLQCKRTVQLLQLFNHCTVRVTKSEHL